MSTQEPPPEETIDVMLPVLAMEGTRYVVLDTLTIGDRIYQGLIPESSLGSLLNQVINGNEPSEGALWVEKNGVLLLPVAKEIIVQLQNLLLVRAQHTFRGDRAFQS